MKKGVCTSPAFCGSRFRRFRPITASLAGLAMACLVSCFQPPSPESTPSTPSTPQEEADGSIVPFVVSRNSTGAPALVAEGDNLYLCYYDQTSKKFLLQRSADRGETWDPALTVYGETIVNLSSAECSMVKNGSSLFILLSDGARMFLAQVSESGGALSLSGCTEQGFGKCSPVITAMGEGFACACYDPSLDPDETGLASYLFFGNSYFWDKDVTTGLYTNSTAQSYPEKWPTGTVAFAGLSLYVDSTGKAWLAEVRNADSQFRIVSYAHGTLAPPSIAAVNIGETATVYVGGALYPSLGYADDSSCYLCYVGRSTGSSASTLSFYSRFAPAGPSPAAVNRSVVVDSSAGCSYPKMVYDSGTAYIAYRDTSTRSLGFARGSLDASGTGYSFSRTFLDRVGAAASDGICALAVSGSLVYVAYLDSSVGGLKLLRSADGGSSW